MTWGFIWLMLALKIPIGGLLYIVWWAVHQVDEPEPEPATGDGNGGTRKPHHPRHPRGPLPRTPRRGQHATPSSAPPSRVRAVASRRRVAVPHS